MDLRPTEQEKQFLTLAYNAFYDVFDEASDDAFWNRDSYYRLSRIRDAFAIYSELLEYEPINCALLAHKKRRPPSENMLAERFFLFIRNLLLHFPFFQSWDTASFDKDLINWSTPNRSVDKFLTATQGRESIKYRIWNPKKKQMIYLSINFPASYNGNAKIFLKDLLSEKEGVLFSLILMKQILDTQVES